MNNLKRVLSLALSGIMLVGMMAMGASAADFSDADTIEHDDAVNILVALNVINGQDDGTFNPKGDVTRGQMAKMIAVAMNGGNDANTGTKTTPSFTDIGNHWAESYIEYCYDMGIISGRGDGTFDPDGNVTGLEAAKMVLTALGYDATAYKLTGAAWAVRTDELARKASPSLYDELGSVPMAVKASRDTAAQLIWNGLQNTTRRVTPSTNTSTGEVTWSYGSGAMMLKERYDADIEVGIFTGNYDMDDTSAQKGEIKISVPKYDKDGKPLTPDTRYVPSDLDISFIGEEVKVIYKNGKNSKTSGADRNDTIYGVFVTGSTEVVTTTRANVKDNKAAEAKIKVGDTTYSLNPNGVTVVTNYVDEGKKYDKDTAGQEFDNGVKDDRNSDLTQYLRGNDKAATGDAIKLLLQDGEVYAIYVVESKVAVVTSMNAERITLNQGIGTLDIEDHDIADDVKKGDVVVATVLYNEDAADGKVTVTKAETVEGEVTGFKGVENVKIDGTTYKIYRNAADKMMNAGLDDARAAFGDDDIGETFTLYMVNGFVGAAVQTSESASNYSVVLENSDVNDQVGSTFKGLQLQVMDAEGVKTIITVADDGDGEGAKGEKFSMGTIITYTMNKDNEVVVKIVGDFDAVVGGEGADKDDKLNKDATSYKKSTKSFKGMVTSGDCVLFATTDVVKDDSGNVTGGKNIKAYNIRDLGDIAAKAEMYNYVVKDGEVVAVFVDYRDKVPGATDKTVYGIITAVEGTAKKNGTAYNLMKASVNGENYDLYVSTTEDNADLKKGAIVSFEPTSDDIYGKGKVKTIKASEAEKIVVGYVDKYNEKDAIITIFTALQGLDEDGKATNDASKIKSYEGKESTRATYAIDSDVKIYYVDQNDDKGVESGSIASFNTGADQANIILILSVEGTGDKKEYTVTAMIVETSDKKPINKW